MYASSTRSPSRLAVLLIRVVAACLIAFFVTAWVRTALTAADDPAVLSRDWTAFHQAAQLLLAGQADEVYARSLDTPLPFAYPPFVLYLLAPLGVLGPVAAYVACTVAGVLIVVATLVLLRRLLPAPPGEHLTVTFVALASAPWIATIIVGQLTPVYLFALVAGFLLLKRGRPVRGGLLLSLLLIKPNFGIVLAGALLWQRRYRALGGFVSGSVALCVASLPLGIAIWSEYLAASRFMVDALHNGAIPMWKQQTLLAALTTLLPNVDPAAVRSLWAVLCAGLVMCLAAVFRQRVVRRDLPRLLAVTVLIMVACNPYTYFYDALLLLMPAGVWYLDRARYAGGRTHGLVGCCILATFVLQHVGLFVWPGMPALAGLTASVWLAGELVDRWRAIRSCRPSTFDRPFVAEALRPPAS